MFTLDSLREIGLDWTDCTSSPCSVSRVAVKRRLATLSLRPSLGAAFSTAAFFFLPSFLTRRIRKSSNLHNNNYIFLSSFTFMMVEIYDLKVNR
jgi:hypothetical protein